MANALILAFPAPALGEKQVSTSMGEADAQITTLFGNEGHAARSNSATFGTYDLISTRLLLRSCMLTKREPAETLLVMQDAASGSLQPPQPPSSASGRRARVSRP